MGIKANLYHMLQGKKKPLLELFKRDLVNPRNQPRAYGRVKPVQEADRQVDAARGLRLNLVIFIEKNFFEGLTHRRFVKRD
jgi:hypothetical protein